MAAVPGLRRADPKAQHRSASGCTVRTAASWETRVLPGRPPDGPSISRSDDVTNPEIPERTRGGLPASSQAA